MSILEMSVEQFMDAIKNIVRGFGVELLEDVDEILVKGYNKYRERISKGDTLEECIPFFRDFAEEVKEAVKK